MTRKPVVLLSLVILVAACAAPAVPDRGSGANALPTAGDPVTAGALPAAGGVSTAPIATPGGSSDPSAPAAASTPVVSLSTPAPTAAPPATGTAPATSRPTAAPAAASTATPHPTPTARPTPTPSPAPTPAATAKPLSACPVFPASNAWNTRVDSLPVDPRSDAYIAAIGLGAGLHPDFSNAGGYGIPFNIVGAGTPRSTVTFQYASESDMVGYPIPTAPRIEGGSDRHLLMVDTSACRLYELFDAVHGAGGWTAGSGATWDLRSNTLRPDGWTSADAAGLPILPGLARADEVVTGAILHALRFTAPRTCAGHIAPARHDAGSGSCDTRPPMGLRVRLKASVDLSGFGPQARVVLVALQRYGMILADNGSPWYITGAPDSRWNDDDLHALGRITGADLEVVDTGSSSS